MWTSNKKSCRNLTQVQNYTEHIVLLSYCLKQDASEKLCGVFVPVLTDNTDTKKHLTKPSSNSSTPNEKVCKCYGSMMINWLFYIAAKKQQKSKSQM